MAKKSIADLERYRGFLVKIMNMKIERCRENVFVVGEVDRFDLIEELSMIRDLSRSDYLIIYEMTMARMSNSIQIENQEISLYQADQMIWQKSGEQSILQRMLDILNDGKNSLEMMRLKQQNISQEFLISRIEELEKDIYIIRDKIKRAEATVIIEVNMNELVPHFLARNKVENLEVSKPEVIEVTEMDETDDSSLV